MFGKIRRAGRIMWILFILLWLISPIVLSIILILQMNNVSELKRQNRELYNKINELTGKGAEQPSGRKAPQNADQEEENAFAEKSAFAEVRTASESSVKPSSSPYDMPYLIPRGAEQLPKAAEIPEQGSASEAVFRDEAKAVRNEAPRTLPEMQDLNASANTVSEKRSVSTINIILILGALLISLAGFIFAAATWGKLNMFFKTALLLSFSAVFFGIHSLAERKLKLEQTGRIFYILGSIFLPAAIAAAGILKVFGEYFCFAGEGRAAVFAAMFFSVCVPFFKGAHDYKFRSFAAVSFGSFSASAVSLIWQFSPGGDITALAMAIFALVIILTEPIVGKLFDRLFGEENILAPEWKRFSTLNAWVLSIVSLFFSGGGLISLAAFAVFSVCFLVKTFTDKNAAAGTVAFAFFIAAALFTGFEPDEMSGFTMIIAAVSLIYATLSAMGLFPDTVKKIMRILAMIAAGIAALLGFIENIEIIAENEIPSLTLIFAAAAVFLQLLVLALRNKTGEYKAMSFGAMLWFSAEIMLYVLGNTVLRAYTFAAAYAFMLVYFAVTRFTGLRKVLYSSANDIIMAAYAFVCAEICVVSIEGVQGGLIGLAVLLAGIILSAFSRQEKFSQVICPILTGLAFFPLLEMFSYTDIIPARSDIFTFTAGTLLILLCLTGTIMLFLPKAEKYAVSYGIAAVVYVPIFVIVSLAEGTSDFVPMLVLTAYTLVYLFRYAFPREQYPHFNLFLASILLTSFYVGGYFTDSIYLLCFPAAALMLVFAVHIISLSFGGFEKIGETSEKFLWFVMPIFSGMLMLIANREECLPVIIFGAVLSLCTVFLSMFRKNTMNMIFPVGAAILILADASNGDLAAVFAVILAAAGHLMFRKRLFEKTYYDIFSIAALPLVWIFFVGSDTDLKQWTALILLAAAVANLIRKEHSAKTNRILMTISTAFIFFIWWTQPFWKIPSLIELEFNLLPAVIFCVILRFIWREAPEKAYDFSFLTAMVCLLILFVGAFTSGESFDSVFIGVVLLIMLAVSFIIKRKRWFVLAVASMVVSAALLSILQLDSIAWLIYLVLTGAALITLGVVNEIKKQQKRSGEDTKLTRFMSDWTW